MARFCVRFCSIALACACCVGSLAGDELFLKLASPDVLRKRLQAGLVPQKDRQAAIRTLFVEAGCEVTEQKIR